MALFVADVPQPSHIAEGSEAVIHLVTLQLLILTAGIVKVCESFGWILARPELWRGYREHIAKLGLLGLMQFQYAWVSIDEFQNREWPITDFAFLTLGPLLYLFSSILLSPEERGESDAFSIIYQKHIRSVAILGIIALIDNSVANYRFAWHGPDAAFTEKTTLRVISIGALGVMIHKKYPASRNWHLGACAVLYLTLLDYIFRLTPTISTK